MYDVYATVSFVDGQLGCSIIHNREDMETVSYLFLSCLIPKGSIRVFKLS